MLKRISLITILAAAVLSPPIAQAHARGPTLTRREARWAISVASQRWLALPAARIACQRLSARVFVCAFDAYGAPHGRLETIACSPACSVSSRFWGVRVILASPRHLVLSRPRHSGYRFKITYPRSTSGRGIITGSG